MLSPLACAFGGSLIDQLVNRVFIVTGLRIQALHFVDSPDFTFSNGYLGLLSVLGALLGVICCCVPSFRPILRRVFQKMSPDNESDVANKVVAESSFETSSRAITSPQATHIPPSRPELEQWGPISHIEHVTHDLSAKRFSNNDTYTIALSVHNV